MNCDRKDCPNPATHQVGFDLRAHRSSVPASAMMGLVVCEECRKKLTVGDVIGDEGWACLVKSFKALHKEPPKRELTVLLFKKLEASTAKMERPEGWKT
jgi:hypothetical protein